MSLEARLAVLEKQVKAQKRVVYILGCALVAVLFVVGVTGAAAVADGNFDTVTAKKVQVSDANGKVRVKLEAPLQGPSGDAKVVILADDGQEVGGVGQYGTLAVLWSQRYAGDKPSALITTSDQSAGVSAASGGGITPVTLAASKTGNIISVQDEKEGKAAVELLMSDKTPAFKITDKDGSVKYLFTLDAKNSPVFRVQDAAVAQPPVVKATERVSAKHDETGVLKIEKK